MSVECQGDRFRIDLLDALDAMPDDTPGAHLDQLRDWVWTVLLARLAAQKAEPQLLAGSGKEPLLRDAGLAHLLEIPVGRTRSAVGAGATVYVLVHRSTAEQTNEDILEAIDHESLLLGETPSRVEIYGVDFRMETAEADLCRIGAADRTWIRSAATGFRERQVTSLEDLGEFLAGGVDLLSASCAEKDDRLALQVTGRRRARMAQAPITPDHLAALDTVPEELRRNAGSFAANIDGHLAEARAAGVEPSFRTDDRETRRLLDRVLAWKTQLPGVATAELVLADHLQSGATRDLGFSLDPRTDVPEALRRLGQLVSALERSSGLVSVLQQWDTPAETILRLAVNATAGDSLEQARAAFVALREQLRHADALSGERLLLEAQKAWSDRVAGQLVQEVLAHSRYQCARYDGPVQATESGMTMFYTDLVAKIWALDWRQSAPTDAVPGFLSVPQDQLSTAYCQDDGDRSHTRIWFGERREGFVRDAPAALRFAPVAVRLFARGSAYGSAHGPEAEPSADMLRFIRWWDRHYAEIAAWEPQYELLNQLVKWMLVQRMEEVSGSPGCLSFLRAAEPDTAQRFDRWRAAHAELRWTQPVALLEYPGETTECLPLFASESFDSCGAQQSLSGGVGLPDTAALADRPIRDPDPDLSLRHLAPETRSEPLPGGGARYPTLERTKGRLTDVEVAISETGSRFDSGMVSDISQRASQHTRPAGFENTSYSKEINLRQEGRNVEARQTLDDFGVLRLEATDLREASIGLRIDQGEYLQARRLAHEIAARMASADTRLETAATAAAGELLVQTLAEGEVAIRLAPAEGSEATYAIMSSGGGVRGPPSGTRFIAGTPHPRGRDKTSGIDVVLVRESQAAPYLRRRQARPAVPDPGLGAVRRSLGEGDLAAAREAAASPETPPAALAEVAMEAAGRGDLVTLESLAKRLIEHPQAAVDLRRLERRLRRLRIELTRRSGDPQTLALLEKTRMKLAIASRRLSPREARREVDRNGGVANLRGPAFAPLSFPREADLPPVSHPLGKPLAPSERFVLEVIDEAVRLSEVPAALVVGGLEMRRLERPISRARPPATAVAQAPRPTSTGSPFRMPLRLAADGAGGNGGGEPSQGAGEAVWPILIVVPCSVDGAAGDGGDSGDRPPYCYRDAGGTGASGSDAAAMHRASQALLACDLDDDGRVLGRREDDCIQQVLRDHAPVMQPYIR